MAAQEIKYKKKKRLGSYPFVSVIISISLALLVIGMFGLLLLQAQNLKETIQSNIEVQVYLDKTIAENERNQIRNILSAKDYVARTEKGPQINFVSKKEAAERFLQDTGEDVEAFHGENPLRDAFIIKVAPEHQSKAGLEKIRIDVESLNGVYEAAYVRDLTESINSNLTKISIVLLAFFILLMIAVIILINNTIKLALFSQRFLIRSMQLVGARGSFIRRPFLLRAAMHGAVGGLLASAGLYGLLAYASEKIEGLGRVVELDEVLILSGILLFMGAAMGYLSALKAMRKYLKLSLDELY